MSSYFINAVYDIDNGLICESRFIYYTFKVNAILLSSVEEDLINRIVRVNKTKVQYIKNLNITCINKI